MSDQVRREARRLGFRTSALVVVAGVLAIWFLLPGRAPAGPAYGEMSAGAPQRITIKAIGVDARVVPVSVGPDAVLDPPANYRQVGWWDTSARPGAGRGQTVVTGHTVHTGGGSMNRIDRLRPGQKIDVVTRNGTMRYRVQRVEVLSQAALAKASVRLFGQRGGSGRLVLVSCADWNGSSYDSNVVVLASPLGVPPRSRA
jgi:LPXTG-site transpeptidase (sortase) family protein